MKKFLWCILGFAAFTQSSVTIAQSGLFTNNSGYKAVLVKRWSL
jgi:hypothetical protein